MKEDTEEGKVYDKITDGLIELCKLLKVDDEWLFYLLDGADCYIPDDFDKVNNEGFNNLKKSFKERTKFLYHL